MRLCGQDVWFMFIKQFFFSEKSFLQIPHLRLPDYCLLGGSLRPGVPESMGGRLASTVQTVQTVQSALYTHGTVLLSVHGWSQQVPVLGSSSYYYVAHRTFGIIHKNEQRW